MIRKIAVLLILGLGSCFAALALASAADEPATEASKLSTLGPGDSVQLQVYGQPDMSATVLVSDGGEISVPLVGPVPVGGLSQLDAAKRVEQELKNRQILVDPHVTITLSRSRSQLVTIYGEIRKPGRYPIDSDTRIMDAVAEAGGITDTGADVIYVLRTDEDGTSHRYSFNTKGLSEPTDGQVIKTLRGGDAIFVPRNERIYIYGEVTAPAMYRFEPGMRVMEAIARAGGITARGSEHRIEIKRLGKDGRYATFKAKPEDIVQPNDVIRVKESIF